MATYDEYLSYLLTLIANRARNRHKANSRKRAGK